jgi:hypothetical protein
MFIVSLMYKQTKTLWCIGNQQNKMVKVSKKTSLLESLQFSKQQQKTLGIELVDYEYKGNYHHQNYSVDIPNDEFNEGNGFIVWFDKKAEKITIEFIRDINNYIYEVKLKSTTDKGIFNQILEDGIKLLQSLEK